MAHVKRQRQPSLPGQAITAPKPNPNISGIVQKLTSMNESTWIRMGTLAESMSESDRAQTCYLEALRNNPNSIPALSQLGSLCRSREQHVKAIEYFQRILSLDPNNGEIWGAIGHCYLMMDDLHKAYSAYQQALYFLPSPREPKLWYGIGILYDRYGSFDLAEEAFSAVIKIDPKFAKSNEIYFRLGIIYKQQQKYDLSLQCFRYILSNPPKPLAEVDILFQVGHVYEQQRDFPKAKEAYGKVLSENPNHAKVLQQMGWLYHQQMSSFSNQDQAIGFLSRSLEADPQDAQTWYLLGRCYMAQQKYIKAYDAYQQAVYRDGRNPTFWCSIGVLYYQINQYPDALDAYSRAIRLNPYIAEVWYDLGTLYESCNNQTNDAIDAYTRALELDPSNSHIKQRLELLKRQQSNPSGPPLPQPNPVQPKTTTGPLTADGRKSPYYQGPPGSQPAPPGPLVRPPLKNPNAPPQQHLPPNPPAAPHAAGPHPPGPHPMIQQQQHMRRSSKHSIHERRPSGDMRPLEMRMDPREIRPDMRMDPRLYKPEMRPEMRSDVRSDMRQELRPDMRQEMRPEIRQEMRPEIRSEMRPEIRSEMRPEIRSEMRPEMRLDPRMNPEYHYRQQQQQQRHYPPQSLPPPNPPQSSVPLGRPTKNQIQQQQMQQQMMNQQKYQGRM